MPENKVCQGTDCGLDSQMNLSHARNIIISESPRGCGLRQIALRNAPHFEMAANQITHGPNYRAPSNKTIVHLTYRTLGLCNLGYCFDARLKWIKSFVRFINKERPAM
jgi:hypothetical protein